MPGTIIKKYREMRNYSQQYIASQLGISQNAYSKIENNITQLTVRHVKELSRILDVPMADLLKDEFEIHKPLALPSTITRADVLSQLELLTQKVESRHSNKHHNYIVVMSLLLAADSSISSVH
jgi:transcriptional regulator with XRE-family HTH domain